MCVGEVRKGDFDGQIGHGCASADSTFKNVAIAHRAFFAAVETSLKLRVVVRGL